MVEGRTLSAWVMDILKGGGGEDKEIVWTMSLLRAKEYPKRGIVAD